MKRRFGLPLAASIVGHGCVVALLVLLVGQLPPLAPPVPIATRGIEVMLAPPQPPVAEPPPPEPPPPPEAQPPPPEPPPPVVEAPPPPQPKPVVKPPPRRPAPRPAPTQAPLQTAVLPRAAPPPSPPPTPTGPIVSAAYRSALSAWLETHKHYPEGARERGEEGRAVLRFRVDRSGRVLGYSLVQSTGHPDLDAAIDQMMRGATLPAFPPDMTASEVAVSVTIRFGLVR